ncbi:hypothetical protein HS1genome_0537 [Sulfodiicoccus acidiphilus]|uniref:Amidohydrolase-related domain-containing protein n=1 Tax=Sulfodiicoccus acidiphilus TaxID=1670455 RepID=A0A348B1U6_9CREN|nr:amidohydrolase family protein [Sulfodiicoccus acidiphilus]BBD72148.1 hypothetical protein HS1genome_0537 [Sulfodiicoccus acidiphilus]
MTQVKGPIDVHSHLVPKELLTELGASISGEGDFTIKVAGKTIGPVTRGFFDVEARMKENERLGVGTQVVSMTHHLFMYNEKVETATKVAKRYNELMSRVCAEHADFVCNATVPLQDGKKAAEELEHAYELGLRGVEIGTNVGGRNLDDQSLFDFYAKAQELNLPIFVHPGT